tara:strand:+ start:1034 stop:1648 length:615 start_codon:yes stop_codon:yes gene_type:complete
LVIKIGVLELQGDFALHHRVFERLEIESMPVKMPSDLNLVDGLVIPGGESTTISLLIDTFNMRDSLIEFGTNYPVMGTCAGLIMMSKKVDDNRVNPLGLLDIFVERNAYGRQLNSSTEIVTYNINPKKKIKLATTLIRAPKISYTGENIHVLGKFNDSPTAVLSGHHLGLSFHPELDKIDLFHQILFDNTSPFYYKNFDKVYAT